MGLLISVVGQKGGPGKSTLARAIATCYAASDWQVKIADLDINQSTSFVWLQRRLSNEIEPTVMVEAFGSVTQALKQVDNFDLYIVDGAPTGSRATLEASKVSDLVVIPTGFSLDDLQPAVVLAQNLVKKGVDRKAICFVFCRTVGTKKEYREATEYLESTGFFVVDGHIDEKTCHRQAMNIGQSILEHQYKAPREKAEKVIQNIINRIEDTTK